MTYLQATVLAFALAAGSASFAENLPVPGKYVSSDRLYTLQIKSSDAQKGALQGTYYANYTPIGTFKFSGPVGGYSWVANSDDSLVPFYIYFGASQRPDDRHYMIGDTWNGVYRADNTILASGVRAYVDSTGVTQAVTLGDRVFTLAP